MKTDINQSKQKLSETFFQRLVDSYGYLPEQMEFNVKYLQPQLQISQYGVAQMIRNMD